jgi:hypothetical protein
MRLSQSRRGEKSETQDDMFPLSQPEESQMPASKVRQMPTSGVRQMPTPGESQVPLSGKS